MYINTRRKFISQLNVKNKLRISIFHKKKKIFCGNICSNRGATPRRTLEVSFTPSNLWLSLEIVQTVLIGCGTIIFITLLLHYLCDTTAAENLATVCLLWTCFQKRASHASNFLLVLCSYSNPTNYTYGLSFSVGRVAFTSYIRSIKHKNASSMHLRYQ